MAFTVSNAVTEVEANLLITSATATTTTPRIKYTIFRGNAEITEYQTGSSTIVGHANAAGAITVGAVNYYKTPAYGVAPVVAPYSSVGGTSVAGEDRQKPDFTAPDGVNTSVFLGNDIANDTDPFFNFFGTSAAAPHAAAVAALVMDGWKRYKGSDLSPGAVRELLKSTAFPFGTSNSAGAGLIQTDVAMRTFASPTPNIISLEYPSTITPENPPTSTFTLTVNGEYFTSESIIYFRDSAITTTYVNNNELTASIDAFTGNPEIKVCTEPLATGDGGCSNILSFFSVPVQTVRVKANDATKKYGEALPQFQFTITVDGEVVNSQDATLLASLSLSIERIPSKNS